MDCSNLVSAGGYLFDRLIGDVEGLTFRDVRTAPFQIHGLYRPETEPVFHRLPDDVARATSEGVAGLQYNTAGGRVRFRTDSQRVAIAAVLPKQTLFPHMTLLGASGFDLYEKVNGRARYVHSFKPATDRFDAACGVCGFPTKQMREFTLNFPLYNGVNALQIGLDADARLEAPAPYAVEPPVVFYGSSITQGACAARPGTCCEAWVSRAIGCDYINLGFAGNAKGEPAIVNYMAGLEMSAFVCDYDHNAPDPAHLRATHAPLYRAIRAAHPDIPFIMLTKPDYKIGVPDYDARRAVVMETFQMAQASGDRNVYFIDGASLFGDDGMDCTTDGCHPTDLGFYRMAEKIIPVLRAALGKKA